MRFLKALWLTIFFFFSLMFFIQNTDVLNQKLTLKFDFYYFDYVWTNTAVPFYFIVLVAFFLGTIVALGYLFMDRLRTKMELSRYRRIVRKQEKELKNLRAIPLEAPALIEGTELAEKSGQDSQNAA